MKTYLYLLIILLFSSIKLLAQIPTFPNPQPSNLGGFGSNSQSPTQRNSGFPQNQTNPLQNQSQQQQRQIQAQNERLKQAIGNKELPPDVLADIWEMEREAKNSTNYHLPSYKNANAQTQAYYTAFDKIAEMLDGKKPLELKKAIFLVENAFFNNSMSWEKFNKTIQDKVQLCLQLMKQKGVKDNSK